ncbi:MFS multidrug transporter, putative [Paecilomyces variotii No. 5]|uniref:MFS multidrug transporter, putative n=1 Tax=Byssochlamys spectabilis (strain No. 5 / NBRC 109023) TaxID=1356009 RepID=V5FZE6_BYSSN|nr:MFS multidrug transporter, putative [Paecilomyces variotii No. 5]
MAIADRNDASATENTPLLATPDADVDNKPEGRMSVGRTVLITVLMGILIFIQSTNISMITTTQSDIAADLDAFSEATWFTSSFLIAMSCVTPLGGRLSQIFSPRNYILGSSLVMAAGLLITSLAKTLWVFLLGRVVTGSGAAGIMATSIILVLELSSKKRRGLFIGIVNAGFTTGVASGAVLAGAVTPVFGWRCIYWIQAPVALVTGPLLFLAIPNRESANASNKSLVQRLARVDYLGILTFTGSLVLLLFSLSSTDVPITPIILGCLLFVSFLFVESKYSPEPIIPVTVLKTRSVLLTCFAGSGLMVARWAVLFYTPVYAIAVRGWSPASAGLILVPTNAGFGLGGLLVGWIHIRKAGSYYISCLTIYLLFTLALLALAPLSTSTSNAAVYVGATFFNGACTGALLNYTLSHVLHLTTPDVHYIVTSLVALFRGLAGSVGSAVGGGLFTRVLKRSLETGFASHGIYQPDLVRRLLGGPALVGSLNGAEKEVAVHSYEEALKTLFLAGSALAFVMTALQAGTGWNPPDNGLEEASAGSHGDCSREPDDA